MTDNEQIHARQFRLCNQIVAGFAKGLYELFDDSALAIADTIGEGVMAEMEHHLGIKIQGENPQAILSQIEQILLDEYGLAEKAHFKMNEKEIDIQVHRCIMWEATEDLLRAEVPPYTCVPMMIASAALRKRMKTKSKFNGIQQDTDQHICNIKFRVQ